MSPARAIAGQLAELTALHGGGAPRTPARELDLVLLTIGANDIHFSGLVANVIVEAATERALLRRGGRFRRSRSASGARPRAARQLRALRAALKPLVGGNLARVVFVPYGNPALRARTPCPGGRDGFDVHPAFGANGERLRQTADFVAQRFLPGIKSLALCEPGRPCRDPVTDRMTFVDAHQPAFADHGVCARPMRIPRSIASASRRRARAFETSLTKAATDPLRCGYVASEYRPYSPRARWVRTANDSYLTAMTYPEGLPALLQPSDLHDAIWGIFAAVYGGAVHPTAEGHAAMADAALPAVRECVALPPTSTVPVFAEPLDRGAAAGCTGPAGCTRAPAVPSTRAAAVRMPGPIRCVPVRELCYNKNMNNRLEAIIDRVLTWPEAAQDEAEQALASIEAKHVRRQLTSEEEAKLAALRETINRSIEQGGSYTDEEVGASIEARLDAWERKRTGT